MDSDGDGWNDADEGSCGTDPMIGVAPTQIAIGFATQLFDDDDDGWSDSAEQACGSNPNDANSVR